MKSFKTELANAVKNMNKETDLPMIFAISKKTINRQQKFVVNKLKLDEVTIRLFFFSAQAKFTKINEDLKKDTTEIKDFFNDDITADDYSELETTNIEDFKDVIRKIYEHRDDLIENEIKIVEKAIFFAVRFKINDELIIYFTKFIPSNIITERNSISAAFSGGSFKSIKGTQVIFPKKIDCIYIHTLKKLLVINKEQIEIMFNYYLYYEQKVDKMIEVLEVTNKVIVFDKKFMNEIKVTKQLPKKITKMLDDGKFNKNKKDFMEAKELFDKNPDWTEKFTKLEFNDEGVTKVDDLEQLHTVLGVCDDSFAKSYLKKEDIFAIKQTKLKK